MTIGKLQSPYLPQPVDGVTLAFPAEVGHLMVAEEDIPDEFWHWPPPEDNKWMRFVRDAFYRGIHLVNAVPKQGIDLAMAWRHLHACLRSFEPKHEHKEANAGYLVSLWFDELEWTVPPTGETKQAA